MPPVHCVRIPAQVVLTANENEDYLIKILLRQTRRPEVNISHHQFYESADAAATLDNCIAGGLMPRKKGSGVIVTDRCAPGVNLLSARPFLSPST